jgi:hypothetical protein
VVRGFALDQQTAYSLLSEWNQRCLPPWSEKELHRKIREAHDKGTHVEWGAHLKPLASGSSSPVAREREPGEDDDEPTPQLGPIGASWRPLNQNYLEVAPPPRRWLLRHPDKDGKPCATGQGDGMLPLSKVGVLASAGGVGKTHALISMAIAVTTGRKWLEHFDVGYDARDGRVLLGLAEEDEEEIHRRMYNAAQAYGLDADDRRRVAERVVALPLAGKPVALVGYGNDGRTLCDTPELLDLRSRLMQYGPWSLVVLDPLARWAGPDVEADNSVATRFLQAVETLTAAPGNPFVMLAHHSSKIARRTGTVDARGVTALTDGARWAGTLRADKGQVFFEQVKSNYSRPMDAEMALVRDRGGLLRVASKDELASLGEAKAAANDEEAELRIGRAEDLILIAIRDAAVPITSQKQLLELVRGRQETKSQALARLVTRGVVTKEGGFFALRIR